MADGTKIPAQHSQQANDTDQAVKPVNLALQGGGAHGAFTWGVLDRLCEEPRISIEGISATSAGAMNGAVFASGLAKDGREGARTALEAYWKRVARAGESSPLRPSVFDRLFGFTSPDQSPAFMAFDLMTRVLSPYQFNPLNLNPLRAVLQQSVDFAALQNKACPVKLFLSATNVRTGKVKIFENGEITADAVLASSCLPFLFQAIEIDGEAYWDGGYMGNPAIFPLIYGCESHDVVIVHINPIERKKLPRTASEIMNRINEISFNSSLMREMRAVSFVTKLIDDGKLNDPSFSRMLIHAIAADDMMRSLGVASKMSTEWEFLTGLRDTGRACADAWITQNFDALGNSSTVDIGAMYL
ncbi:MAG: patatin-like phospholipase family protein [Pseudomonadota bacterium]